MITQPNYQSILNEVNKEVFVKEKDSSINIFLCGKEVKDKVGIRYLLNKELKNIFRANVIYPEWVFADALHERNENLLTLEHYLADDVDMIIVPLESPGTYAELGAFASKENVYKKITVINFKQFRWKRSFINLGPISLIKDQKPENVIYVEENEYEELLKNISNKVKAMSTKRKNYNLGNIFNLSRFVLQVVGVLDPVNKEELTEELLRFDKKLSRTKIEAAIKVLFKKERITKQNNGRFETYSLSPNGKNYLLERLIPQLGVEKKFFNEREKWINKSLRKLNKRNFSEEVDDFLESDETK